MKNMKSYILFLCLLSSTHMFAFGSQDLTEPVSKLGQHILHYGHVASRSLNEFSDMPILRVKDAVLLGAGYLAYRNRTAVFRGFGHGLSAMATGIRYFDRKIGDGFQWLFRKVVNLRALEQQQTSTRQEPVIRPAETQTGLESKDNSQNDCFICRDDLLPSDHYTMAPCGHSDFHAHCIRGWFRQQAIDHSNRTCPICRQDVQNVVS